MIWTEGMGVGVDVGVEVVDGIIIVFSRIEGTAGREDGENTRYITAILVKNNDMIIKIFVLFIR